MSQEPGLVTDDTLSDRPGKGLIVGWQPSELSQGLGQTTIGDKNVNEGDIVNFTASAVDSDVPTQSLTYSLNEAPTGATIGSGSGLFTWTTGENDGPGVSTVTVVASDGILTDSKTIQITVNEVSQAPVLAAIAD